MNNHNDFLENLCRINKQTSNKYGVFETHWIICFPLFWLLNIAIIIIHNNHFKILYIITWAISYCLPYLPDASHILLRLPIFANSAGQGQIWRSRQDTAYEGKYGRQYKMAHVIFYLSHIIKKKKMMSYQLEPWWISKNIRIYIPIL